jgi:hypothetical protein
MDIGTIIAGLQAIASVADAINKAPQLTPAQAEEKKQKVQPIQPLMPMVVVLPNQTPPLGVGVLPFPPSMRVSDYWNQLPPSNVLRNFILRMPKMPVDMPTFQSIPLNADFNTYNEPLLDDLYQLYFGTRR